MLRPVERSITVSAPQRMAQTIFSTSSSIEDETADSSLRVCLVCWVPPLMLERAAAGVEVNPEGCIRWLDDCRPKLRALWEAELSRRPAGNR